MLRCLKCGMRVVDLLPHQGLRGSLVLLTLHIIYGLIIHVYFSWQRSTSQDLDGLVDDIGLSQLKIVKQPLMAVVANTL